MDTNVLIAGLRSRNGASYKLLASIGEGDVEICLSVGLFFEYEAALKRPRMITGLSVKHIDDVLDYLAVVAVRAEIFYLWRPVLPDPGDDMVLEAAVSGRCSTIVTHNSRDFQGAEMFGIHVLTPAEFMHSLEKQR